MAFKCIPKAIDRSISLPMPASAISRPLWRSKRLPNRYRLLIKAGWSFSDLGWSALSNTPHPHAIGTPSIPMAPHRHPSCPPPRRDPPSPTLPYPPRAEVMLVVCKYPREWFTPLPPYPRRRTVLAGESSGGGGVPDKEVISRASPLGQLYGLTPMPRPANAGYLKYPRALAWSAVS